MIKRLNLGKIRRIIFPWRNLSRKKQRILIFTALLVLAVGISTSIYILKHAGITEASWWNDNWSYRKALQISGSVVDADLTDFPVLVSLTSSQIDFSKAQTNGQDLRFTDLDGNGLSYEIVSWDSGGQTAEVWVKVPKVYDDGTTIYMYYGNSAAQDAQKVKDVWSNGFSHVYHLNNSTLNSVNSNTSAGSFGTDSIDTTGKIGKGREKETPYSGSVFTTTEDRKSAITTIEAWFKPDGFRNWDDVLTQGWVGDGFDMYVNSSGVSTWSLGLSGGQHGVSASSSLTDGVWAYMAGTYDGSTITFYLNGTSNGTPANVSGAASDLTSSINSILSTDRGSIDEIRISYVVRSAAWLKASYNSGNNSLVTYGSEEQSPGPVAYWKFDEGTGSVANDSVGKNNGSITGATWIDKSQCVSEKCLKFNGSSDYVSMSNSASLNAATGLTVEAWIKPTSIASSTNYNIVAKQDWGAKLGYRLALSGYGCSNNCLFFGVGDGTTRTEFNPGTIGMNDLGNWHHVVGVFSSGSLKIYVDGVLRASTTTAVTSISNTSSSLAIGRHSSGGEYFPGYIDDVKIYNYARTADQVKADFNKGGGTVLGASNLSTLSNGLVGYWKMDEASWDGTSGEVKDTSGNGNNGTSVSGAEASPSAKFGNAGYFPGVDEQLLVPSSSSMNLAGAITLSAWIYAHPSQADHAGIIVGRDSSAGVTFEDYAMVMVNNSLRFNYYNGTTWFDQDCGTVPTDEWAHVVVTRDVKGEHINCYVNGSLTGSYTGYGVGGNYSSNPVSIGADQRFGATSFFDGNIDEARIYNRALSPSEVSQLYHYAPGPVAYYNFEEGKGGTVNDISGTGNNGTWTGSSYSVGKYGKAGSFTGSSFVSLGSPSSLNIVGGLTVSAWIYPTTLDNNYNKNTILSGRTGETAAPYNLGITGSSIGFDNHVLSGGDGNGWQTSSISTQIPLNQWTYITVTRDSSYIYYYKNGIYLGKTALVGPVDSTYNGTLIGKGFYGGSYYFNGKIDEVKIYNYPRTSGQIVEDMNGGHPIGGSPIGFQVGYWKFDEGYGTTAHNSGNGGGALDGIITNATWTNGGKNGKALNYDGVGDYTTVSHNSALNFGTDSFTVSYWLNFNPGSTQERWSIGKGTPYQSAGAGWAVSHWSTGNPITPGLYISDGTGAPTSHSVVFEPIYRGTWHQLTFVVDRSSDLVKTYVDGIYSHQLDISSLGSFDNSSDFLIGTGNGTANTSDVKIDEVKIYNSALTAEQVKLDYNSGQSLKFGSLGTESDGKTPSDSMDRAYCPPGDTTTTCGPIGEWKFEEGGGLTANDTSANGRTGTLTNGPAWIAGKVGKALSFDGTDDSVVLTNGPDISSGNWTMQAWIYPTVNRVQWQHIFGAEAGTFAFGISSGNLAVTNVTVADCTASSISPPLNAWSHVAATFNDSSNTLSYYVNGVLANTVTCNTTPTAGRLTQYIGRSLAYSSPFAGKIDQAQIYDYVLSSAQIAWNYNRGKPVAHYKLDECQGSTVHSSGTAYDASLNGTITVGGSGTQTSVGTCQTSSTAWGNGATGKYNSSLSFDGTDDNIIIGDISSLEGLPAVTLSAWINPGSLTGSHDIIQKENTYNFRMSGSDVECWVYDGSYKRVALAPLPTGTGTWANLTCTWSAGSAGKIYINGKDATTSTNTASSMSTNSYNVTVGSRISSEWFSGQIDDVQIFNYALTPIQVKNLYNQGAGIRFGP